jgi:hypothetical protein
MPRPTRTDWLLRFIAGTDGYDGAVDVIRLMKGMFLFQEEKQAPPEVDYKFKPYDYGPFTPEIYRDTERLAEDSLVIGSPEGKSYRVTEVGRRYLAGVKFDAVSETELVDLRVEIDDLSFRDLLRRVYLAHPESAKRSIAKDVLS